MVANAVLPSQTDTGNNRYHVYHAEAEIISGDLRHPIKQPIELAGHVVLEKTRREGHITRSTEATTLEGLISFETGHTRASGNKVEKKDLWGNDHSAWVTLTTSVIEGLNVFEVITADRIVAQVSTDHPVKDGHVPKVTFLGTKFENLRISGYPVELEFDLSVCGARPEKDRTYLEDIAFLDRARQQLVGIADAKGIPSEVAKDYKSRVECIDVLRKRASGQTNGSSAGSPKVDCSLVKSIGPIPIPGVQTFGNLILIPDFGLVSLAEIEVGLEETPEDFADRPKLLSDEKPGLSTYFTLNMLNMRLGCIGGGDVKAGTAKANGMTRP